MSTLVSDDNTATTHTARITLPPIAPSSGRVLVIGDLHGCSAALELMLAEMAPRAEDTVVVLGDYVDRGPDSRGVLNTIIGLEARTRVVPILGNHELLMMDAKAGAVDPGAWFSVGGRQTMESYGTDLPDWSKIPEEHWDFLHKRLQRYHVTDTHIFVHANANAMVPMEEQMDDWLFWRRFDDSHPHFSGKTLICGHTAQKSGLPNLQEKRICIDTWAYGDGWLTGLDAATETFVQTSQRGEVRRLSFEEVRKMREKA
ncbi:MAG: metallophosphoesterase family protein [Prosthecobacter sp.]